MNPDSSRGMPQNGDLVSKYQIARKRPRFDATGQPEVSGDTVARGSRRVTGRRHIGGACHDMGLYTGNRPPNYVSICTGIAGIDSAIHATIPGIVPLVYMENEITAIARLAAYMEAKLLPAAPIWSDVRSFDGRALRDRVDLLVGGYPCQPYSQAGKGLGADDPRDLWSSIARLVDDMQPAVVFFENVSGHLSSGFDRVGEDLQALGYRFTCALAEAIDAGAPHHRLRIFILGWRPDVADTGRYQFQRRGNPDNILCAESGARTGEHASPPVSDSSKRNDAAGLENSKRMVVRGTNATGESDEQDRITRQSEQSSGTGVSETLGNTGVGGMARGVNAVGGIGGSATEYEGNKETGNTRLTSRPIPRWPLLPDDDKTWRGLLAEYPLLSPALPLSVFRRMADVQSDGDQPDVHLPCTCNRTDRIRLLGNAVCTDQAIIALRYLWHEAFNWQSAECPHILTIDRNDTP